MSDWKRVPWDSKTFGFLAYEALEPSEKILKKASKIPGHWSVKVRQPGPVKALLANGFYYCGTLVTPYCDKTSLSPYFDPRVRLGPAPLLKSLAAARNAFGHGRFHRDPEIPRALAEKRYANWLRDLHKKGRVTGLYYGGKFAGFIAAEKNRLVLHALARAFRGKGLAKYFWSAYCRALFDGGAREITSSVSASNSAALDLYASLGFRFKGVIDVYHKRTRG
jgi:RimJ/RimL family protein N-acetyltransferase